MKTIYVYGNGVRIEETLQYVCLKFRKLTGNLPELPGLTCPLLQALDFSNNKVLTATTHTTHAHTVLIFILSSLEHLP